MIIHYIELEIFSRKLIQNWTKGTKRYEIVFDALLAYGYYFFKTALCNIWKYQISEIS